MLKKQHRYFVSMEAGSIVSKELLSGKYRQSLKVRFPKQKDIVAGLEYAMLRFVQKLNNPSQEDDRFRRFCMNFVKIVKKMEIEDKAKQDVIDNFFDEVFKSEMILRPSVKGKGKTEPKEIPDKTNNKTT